MPQLVMLQRVFAGVPVTVATTVAPPPESDQPRRIVALGWISRDGSQVVISDRLIGSVTTHAGR